MSILSFVYTLLHVFIFCLCLVFVLSCFPFLFLVIPFVICLFSFLTFSPPNFLCSAPCYGQVPKTDFKHTTVYFPIVLLLFIYFHFIRLGPLS